MYDIIIIGAGPAGLTAAIYAKRANKSVLVIEKNSYGGQIINAQEIANYPAIMAINGFDFATNLYQQALNLGVEIIYETAQSIANDYVITNKGKYQYRALIIATGLHRRVLGLYGEKELVGAGISYCATCDGNFYKGSDVAVVGGGNTALEDALYLAGICHKVYLIHRRDAFTAAALTVEKVKATNNIELELDSQIEKINGDKKITSIEIQNAKTGNYQTLDIQALFIAIGYEPNNDFIKNILTLDNQGYILASEEGKTNVANIFVAGDCRQKSLRQLTTAVADGANAATSAIKYLI